MLMTEPRTLQAQRVDQGKVPLITEMPNNVAISRSVLICDFDDPILVAKADYDVAVLVVVQTVGVQPIIGLRG